MSAHPSPILRTADIPVLQQLPFLLHSRLITHPRAPALDIVIPTSPMIPSREGMFLQSLHPALVALSPTVDTQQRWMARLPAGISLAEHIQTTGPLDALQLATILRQIAAPLDTMHRLGYAHGWLSADLLWLLPDERVLIAGCGLGTYIRQSGGVATPADDRRMLALLTEQALRGPLPRRTVVPAAVARVIAHGGGTEGFPSVEALADALRAAAHRAEPDGVIDADDVSDDVPLPLVLPISLRKSRPKSPVLLMSLVAAIIAAVVLALQLPFAQLYTTIQPALAGLSHSVNTSALQRTLPSSRPIGHTAVLDQAQQAMLDGAPQRVRELLAPIADVPAARALLLEADALQLAPIEERDLALVQQGPATPERDRALLLARAARAYASADTPALRAAYTDASALVGAQPIDSGASHTLAVLTRGEIALWLATRTGDRTIAAQARTNAQTAITAGTASQRAMLLLARAATLSGDYHLAARTLDELLLAHGSDGPIALAIGWNALSEGQRTSAEQQFAIAMRDPATTIDALLGAARLAELREDHATRAKLLHAASTQAPHRADIAALAGWAMRSYGVFLPERSDQQQHAFATASGLFTHAITINPSYADPYTGLGWVFQDTAPPNAPDAYAVSVASFKTALTLDPNQPFAHNGLGWSLLALHEYAEAQTAFEHALALQPTYDDALFGLGQARLGIGDIDGARSAYERAADLGNDNARMARAALR